MTAHALRDPQTPGGPDRARIVTARLFSAPTANITPSAPMTLPMSPAAWSSFQAATPEPEAPDHSAEEGAHDAEGRGAEQAHRLGAGHDRASDEAYDETEHEEKEDTHEGRLSWERAAEATGYPREAGRQSMPIGDRWQSTIPHCEACASTRSARFRRRKSSCRARLAPGTVASLSHGGVRAPAEASARASASHGQRTAITQGRGRARRRAGHSHPHRLLCTPPRGRLGR